MHNNKKDAKLFAPYEVWTHDPQFTRLVLYHWAKGASYKIVATFSTLLFFCHHPCASSRQPTENISNQGLVNLFRYLNRKSFGYNCASRIIPHALKLLQFSSTVRLAEWSKAWDLSSHNRKIAWVRTPHLANNFFFTTWGALNCFVSHLDWLQWRNRLAHGTYRQCNEECRGCEFEPHLEQHLLIQKSRYFIVNWPDNCLHTSFKLHLSQQILDSLVVRISACHVEGPGSIPGRGGKFFPHFWHTSIKFNKLDKNVVGS